MARKQQQFVWFPIRLLHRLKRLRTALASGDPSTLQTAQQELDTVLDEVIDYRIERYLKQQEENDAA